MKVTQINNTFLQSCSYIIEDKYLWLIDCGSIQPINNVIDESGKQLKGVFLTHCHQDHIYGLCELLNLYPNTKIYCSLLTSQGLYDEKMNLSFIMPEYPCKLVSPINVIVTKEGKQNIDGLEMEVISTPGHSDDCFTYIIGDNIFTGDSYIPFSKVFAKWPRSNKPQAIENEQFLKRIIEDRQLNVFCGHWK